MEPTVQHVNTIVSESTLIVDGLALSATSEDLIEAFSTYGKVVWARVALDRFKGSLGYGYVVMASVKPMHTKPVEALTGRAIAGRVPTIHHTAIPLLPRIA